MSAAGGLCWWRPEVAGAAVLKEGGSEETGEAVVCGDDVV